MNFETGRGGYAEQRAEEQKTLRSAEYILTNQNSEHSDRLKEADFEELYQKDEILKDKKMVERMKEKFSEDQESLTKDEILVIRERKTVSEAMEKIIVEGGEIHNWFGGDSSLIQTTEYDDIFNGIDVVLEIEIEGEENKRIALVVDVTMSSDTSILQKKIANNLSSITGKKPKEVKYFRSEITDEAEKIQDIIPVVVGLDKENSSELLTLFANIQRLKNVSGKSENDRKKLKENLKNAELHPAQKIFLNEIAMQLETYLNINIKKEMKNKIEETVEIIYTILSEKKKIDITEIENDGCYQNIKKLIKK
jgi:hypothetical protein